MTHLEQQRVLWDSTPAGGDADRQHCYLWTQPTHMHTHAPLVKVKPIHWLSVMFDQYEPQQFDQTWYFPIIFHLHKLWIVSRQIYLYTFFIDILVYWFNWFTNVWTRISLIRTELVECKTKTMRLYSSTEHNNKEKSSITVSRQIKFHECQCLLATKWEKHCSNEIKEQKAEANKLPCHPENSKINFNINPFLNLSM